MSAIYGAALWLYGLMAVWVYMLARVPLPGDPALRRPSALLAALAWPAEAVVGVVWRIVEWVRRK